jgi:Ni,Fe-hydrogenase III large subunit
VTQIFEAMEQAMRVSNHAPWPRFIVTQAQWETAVTQFVAGVWEMVGLWGDGGFVHMAIRDSTDGQCAVLSLACPENHYPSVAARHPPAMRLERGIRDLFGLAPDGLPDDRPWLDHGRWGVQTPLRQGSRTGEPARPYRFLPVEGESLHQVAVGPVHAGIIEPGFFRFMASGETVVRLEERLGYTHKGIEKLMQGADLTRGIRIAGRTSGDSTVAYAYAFARAAEAALQLEIPPRAVWLRALMAELERLANHIGDFGAVCNDASFAVMLAQCAVLRERVLRTADACFGHRMMRDCILVGGVDTDFGPQGHVQLVALLDEVGRRLPRLIELYDSTASLQDRTVGTGILKQELARQYACGGYVGRASGRAFDARKSLAYAPYDQLAFDVPVLFEGDVNARVWLRLREIEQSVSLIRQILAGLPHGDVRAEPQQGAEPREGIAMVEGFRGDVLVWLRLAEDGRIARCHLRDPSWFQWPVLEAAIDGNIIADFPICNKSFNCSYSGHDL